MKMSEQNKTVLQVQNTQSAIDVVFDGVTIDKQVPDHLITTGVTLDQVLVIDKNAGALSRRILDQGGYAAFPSHVRVPEQFMNKYSDKIRTSKHPYTNGTIDILTTHPAIKSGEIQRVLLHSGAAYERGKMSGQDDNITGVALFVSDEYLPDKPYVRMVTGRSAEQMLQRPYAAEERDPNDRLDNGMLYAFGMLMYTNDAGQEMPHYVEDGAVLLKKQKAGAEIYDAKTELNIPEGIDGAVMTGLIERLEEMIPELNNKYAQFTQKGNDPFFMPSGKLTRLTINLPKMLRDHEQRTEVEDLIMTEIKKYAEEKSAGITDKRDYVLR